MGPRKPTGRSDSGSRPPEDDERTERRRSPYAPEEGGEWEAPPGRASGQHPLGDEAYSTGSDYPEPESSGEQGYAYDQGELDGAELESSMPDASGGEVSDPGPTTAGEDDDELDPLPDPEGSVVRPTQDPDLDPVPPRSKTQTRIAALGESAPVVEEPVEPDDDNATRAGPPVKLQIIAGPDAGKKKRFSGVRMVVGRTAGCDLKLADQSISRRHLELVQGDAGILLRDLGSGNGTKVNGEKVSERLLKHLDEIVIGQTTLRLFDDAAALKLLEEEAAKPKEASVSGTGSSASESPSAQTAAKAAPVGAALRSEADPADPRLHAATSTTGKPVKATSLKDRWRALSVVARVAVAVGAALVLVGLVGTGLYMALRKPPVPPVDPKVVAATEKMDKAREAVRAEKFAEAVQLVTEAEAIVPGSDADGLLARAQTELAAVNALAAAREALEAGRFDEARMELTKVSGASIKRDEDRKKLSREIEARELQWRMRRVRQLIDEGDFDEAERVLGALPGDVQEQLRPDLLQARKDAKRNAAAQAEKIRQNKLRAQKEIDAARKAEIDAALVNVARKFHAGEYDRAVRECDRVYEANGRDADIRRRARELQQLIPSFSRNFEEGHRKYKQGLLVSSVRPLRRSRDLFQQIGFGGALGEQIDEELAAASVQAGIDALGREDLVSAAVAFNDAARLKPDDPRPRDGLEKVAAKAERLFELAYMIRERDPQEAVAKFKIVLQVTPPGSTYHERAKTVLANLQP